MLKLLIGAGHRNNQGGNEFETDLNGRTTRAIVDMYRQRGGAAAMGFELRCYTPDDGLGWSPLDLNRVPLTGFKPDWIPNLMVELHSEGAGPNVRGSFVIAPEWGSDVDVDIQRYGLAFPQELQKLTGIPIRTVSGAGTNGPGLMSEKRTGVGLDGFRLGVFRDTAVFGEVTSRTIFEAGSHDNAQDRAIMVRPDFTRLHAEAFFAAVRRFFDATEPGWNAPAPSEYVPSKLMAEAGGSAAWLEVVDAGVPIRLAGIRWTYDRRKMKARRPAVCRAAPSDTAPKTRRNLVLGEEVTAVFKGQGNDGINWRVTKYGTCIRASALSAVV
jgi:hypothetical protein